MYSIFTTAHPLLHCGYYVGRNNIIIQSILHTVVHKNCCKPVHTAAWQASLAVCHLAHSCGMEKVDPPDDMQAEIQQQNIQMLH